MRILRLGQFRFNTMLAIICGALFTLSCGTLFANAATILTHTLIPIGGGDSPDVAGLNYIGSQYSVLNNATQRSDCTVTQSGAVTFSSGSLASLFDGSFSSVSASGDITESSPLVITVTFPPFHPQGQGITFGWASRYSYPTDFKIEANLSTDPNGTYSWTDLVSRTSNYASSFYMGFANPARYINSFKLTVYDAFYTSMLQLSEIWLSSLDASNGPYDNIYLSTKSGVDNYVNGNSYFLGSHTGVGTKGTFAPFQVNTPILAGAHANQRNTLFGDGYNNNTSVQYLSLSTLTNGSSAAGWNLMADRGGRLSFGATTQNFNNVSSPVEYLSIVDHSGTGRIGIDTTNPSTNFEVNGDAQIDGDLTVTGTFCYSDLLLKSDVKEIKGALETLSGIRGVSYRWNDRYGEVGDKKRIGQKQVGLIAQEVEKALPESVITGPKGYKEVDYTRMIPVLVEAVKELRAEKDGQIADLKSRVRNLQKRNAELKTRLDRIERAMTER